MKHISSRVITFTALYIFIIFVIFVIQFTKGETFSSALGVMTVSGRYESGKNGEKIPLLPLHIVSNGLDFYISEQTPIKAVTSGGKQLPLKVLSYGMTENSFAVHCSEDISINFKSDVRGDVESINIYTSLPEQIDAVFFPWKLTRIARLERRDGKMFLQYGKRKFVFSGGAGFSDSDKNLKNLKENLPHLFLSKHNPSIYYHTYIPVKGIVLEKIPENPLSSEAEYLENISSFTETALYYFKKSISDKTYNEAVLTAFIAEKGRRGLYNSAFTAAPASSLPKNKRTYLSCPFYGNIVDNNLGLLEDERNKRAFLTREIPARNYEIFNVRGLLPYLLERDSEVLINDLISFAENAELSKITPLNAACILELSMDYALFFPGKENIFEKLSDTCERKIKEKLFFINSGLYVSSDDKNINSMDTLYISRVLIRYGKEKKSVWKEAGQMLFNSLFLFSGESASLPSSFIIEAADDEVKGLMADDSEILYPEDLYAEILFDNTWYPHSHSLVKQFRSGCWAWTVAEDITVTENSRQRFSFTVKFQENESHYMIIRGIPPFTKIKIHDIDFRTDPRFEIYNSSGYAYNAGSRTLYLKLKHKTEKEKIILFFE